MSSPRAEPVAPSNSAGQEALAFRVDGVGYRWADVVAHARRRGDWQIFEIEVRQALACLRLAAEEGPPLARGAERAMATAFRRQRGLLAAEDLEAWLVERGLTVDQWRRYVRGEALRRRHAAELDTVIARHPPGDEAVGAALPVWGACSGAFVRWAEELATRAAAGHAACHGRDPPERPPDPDDAEAHEALFDRFVSETATPERLERLLAERYLDWLRVDCDVAVFADADTAREALLCVRDDGWSLAEAARAARAALQRRSLLVEEVDADVRHLFVRARDGDVLGPLPWFGEPAALVRVRHKRAPSLDDDELRATATRHLIANATAREVADRVQRLHPG